MNYVPSPETIEELRSEHDEMYLIPVENEVFGFKIHFIVQSPSQGAYRRFVSMSTNDKKRVLALENLFQDCVIWPQGDDLDDVLRRKPGVVATVAEQLAQLAGIVEDTAAKKL